MKKITAIILAALTLAASAQYINEVTGQRYSTRPNPLATADGYKSPPSEADYLAAGIRSLTAQELADDAEAAAEAAAAAEALVGPNPEVFVPMLDGEGHELGTARLFMMDGVLVATTNTASPKKAWAIQKAEAQGKIAANETALDELVEAIDKANSPKKLGDAIVEWIRATQ